MSPQFRKGPPSSSVANYRPLFIISVFSKPYGVWALGDGSSWTIYGMRWCASNHPVCLSERSGYNRTSDSPLCVSHTHQSILKSRQEAMIVQIDDSAAFRQLFGHSLWALLCGYWRFCVVYINGLIFYQTDHSFVMVDGCRSKLVNVVSGVPKERVFGPLLFLLYTSEFF